MKSSSIVILSSVLLLSPCVLSAQSNDIAPTLRQTLNTAHADWKGEGGSEFKSGLTYVQGIPFLMVITDHTEAADKLLRRKRSIVSACDFLLDDGAFAKAVICVVRSDPKNPKTPQTVSNFEVLRGNYQEAIKKAAHVTNPKEGARKARESDSIVASACADLGIK